MRGDLGLGERRPRRHALEELAGRDGVLHRLRRDELMLNGGSKHRTFLANFSKSNPSRFSISRSSSKNRVGRLPPSPNTGAMSSLPVRRNVGTGCARRPAPARAFDQLELRLGVAHAPGARLVGEQRRAGLAPEGRRAVFSRPAGVERVRRARKRPAAARR